MPKHVPLVQPYYIKNNGSFKDNKRFRMHKLFEDMSSMPHIFMCICVGVTRYQTNLQKQAMMLVDI